MPWQPELPFITEKLPAADETPRTIILGSRVVPYLLRRARRRTVALSIDHRGLRVGAPTRASLRDVESLILRHGDWVMQKLDEWNNRRRIEPLKLTDGVGLPLLGRPLTLRLALGNNHALWTESPIPTLTLCLRSPADASRLLEKTLRERALPLFAERLSHYARLLGLDVPPLKLSSARTRWGSCSLKSGIRLNWRLIHFPPEVINYVVIHELAHLREMNHSPRFWAIVEQACPNYRRTRSELKDLAVNCPSW